MQNDFLGRRTPADYTTDETLISLPVEDVEEGVTVFEKVVAYRSGDDVRFFDRVCDHNGGHLISTTENRDVMRCPLHNWVFDPKQGRYTNVAKTKEPLAFERTDQDYVIRTSERTLDWPTAPAVGDVDLTFLNHACFVIDIAGKLRFATDPWVLGSAFCDGWWLSEPSPDNAIDLLQSCDFIYISHNHPDHLHAETLRRLDRKTRFVVPNFTNQSVGRYLTYLGFENVYSCDFADVFDFDLPGFKFTILKSGDFRDDSGIIFSYGDFTAVMAVDCNALNHFALPKGVTLLATSFAGGASGFPLCFENYDETEKKRIVSRNRGAIAESVQKYIDATAPAMYVPYAGYFKEDPVRDEYVATRNKKNSVDDIGQKVRDRGVGFINPLETRNFTFRGRNFVGGRAVSLAVKTDEPTLWYDKSAELFADISDEEICAYFRGTEFNEALILYIHLCDVDFSETGRVFAIDFRQTPVDVSLLQARPTFDEIAVDDGTNRLIIDVRAPAFGRIVREFLPWEDFIIGFQARIERWPNVYNSRMWYYFTNTYIVDFARKAAVDCGQSCERLSQEVF